MAVKSASTGQFTIPTAPSAGTTVASSSSANTYGSYVELLASTSAAVFVIGAVVTLASGTNDVSYCSIALATGAAASEVLKATIDLPVPFENQASGTRIGFYVPFDVWVAIPTTTRIAAKTADDVASAMSWKVKLIAINQVDVLDAGVREIVQLFDIPGYARNVAATLQFAMFDTAGEPVTGLVDGDFSAKEESLDEAAYATLAGTIAEVGRGVYAIPVTAGETDADRIAFNFEAPGARRRVFTIKTNT